jgi:hypothetical protein
VFAVVLVVGLGCGGATNGPTAAIVTATLTPDVLTPVVCVECGPAAGQLELRATLTLREGAGVGATVESVGVLFRNDAGAVVAQGEFDTAAVVQLAGSNRLPAGGALAIPLGIHFGDSARRPGTFTATPVLRDERGNRTTLTASRPVAGL